MPGDSNSMIADQFADHIMNKISKIRHDLKQFEHSEPSVKNVPSFKTFGDLTEEEVKKII